MVAPEHEQKWALPAGRATMVAHFLARRLRADPVYPTGWVASLYYDTPDWRFLGEKLSSDYLKTKVRLRWYEDEQRRPLGPRAFLEVKCKIGSARTKLRLPCPIDADLLVGMSPADPRLRRLPDLARAHGVRLPTPLTPVFVVRYRRRRYVDPISGARVSLDDRVHVPAVHPAHVSGSRRPLLDLAVVEVKGAGMDLPALLLPLVDLGCRRQAISKYAACHASLMDPLLCP